MKTSTATRRISVRTSREDGEATKAKIIEAAGQLFSERGYAEVTSKEICEAADANVTSVNYHFGSKEGLYTVIIKQVHDDLLSSEALNELAGLPLTPREKLEKFIDILSTSHFDDRGWQIRLWAREVVAPSAVWLQVVHENSMPKMDIILRILSEETGIPLKHPMLNFCFLGMMSPFMVLLMTWCSRQNAPDKHIFNCESATIMDNIKDFIFAGLDKIAEKYAKEQAMASADLPT